MMKDTSPLIASPLIPGRECGECFACCTIPRIESELFQKPSGVVCHHYAGQGCSIYATRPQVCRDFHCEWRHQAMLDDSWRPDRSGVMITSRYLDEQQGGSAAMVLVVFGDHDVIFDEGFAILVATSIDRGMEAILSLPSGPDQLAREARLSQFAGEAVAAVDLAGVQSGIRAAYSAVMAMPVR